MIAGGKEPLLAFVVDRLEVGIFAVDAEMRVVLWNRFMSMYSGKPADEVMGAFKPLFTDSIQNLALFQSDSSKAVI